MNGLQIKLQLDDNQPAHWFDVETINFDDEVCFTDGVGEHIEIEYQGEPLRIKPPSLTDDQQKYLKQMQYNHERLGNTHDALFFGLVDYEKRWNFNDEDFVQVLAAFAEWGLNSFQNGNG